MIWKFLEHPCQPRLFGINVLLLIDLPNQDLDQSREPVYPSIEADPQVYHRLDLTGRVFNYFFINLALAAHDTLPETEDLFL